MEKKLITALLFLGTVLLAGYAVSRGTLLWPVLIAGVVLCITLIMRPKLLLLLLVCSGISGFKIMGLGGRLSLQELLFTVAVAYGVLHTALSHRPRKPLDLSETGLLVFGMTLVILMWYHGVGFSLLGSKSFGGKDYLALLLAMMAYKAVQSIRLNERETRRLVYWFAGAALIPVFAQVFIYFVPSAFPILDRIIKTNADYLVQIEAGAGGYQAGDVARVSGANPLAAAVWLLVVAVFWKRSRGKLFLATGCTVILTFFAGFRAATFSRAVLSGIALVATGRRKMMTVMVLGTVAFGAYVVLMGIGQYLPLNMQRSLSVLPGISWDPRVIEQGADSLDWRLDIWSICWQNLPSHLFIGRGLMIQDVAQHAWFGANYYMTPEFFYAAHGYHSGPLSLLLDTGIPGLIGFLLFQIGLAKKALRYYRESAGSGNTFLRGYMLALTIVTIYGIVSYYLIFGDIKETLPKLVMDGILIRVVGEALLQGKADAQGLGAAAPERRPRIRVADRKVLRDGSSWGANA